MGTDDDQLTLAEAAELLGLAPATLRILVCQGRQPTEVSSATIPARAPATDWQRQERPRSRARPPAVSAVSRKARTRGTTMSARWICG